MLCQPPKSGTEDKNKMGSKEESVVFTSGNMAPVDDVKLEWMYKSKCIEIIRS